MKNYWFVLMLLLMVFSCKSKKDNGEKDEKEPAYTEGFLEVDDSVRIFYQRLGDGKDITVIPAGWWLYDDFKQLVRDDRSFIFFDMRNRGRSDFVKDTSLITIHREIEDIEKLRKHFNADKINLIGFSYLGLLVMLYTDKYPDHVAKVIQIGPVPIKWGTSFPDSLRNTVTEPEIEKGKLYVDSLLGQKYDVKEPEKFTRIHWDTFARKTLVGNPSNYHLLGKQWGDHIKYSNEWDINFMRHLKYHFGSILTSTFTTQQFADIKSPVLVIHGTKDRNAAFGAGKEWASILPNAKLVRIEGGAHVPWAEYPDKVFNTIDSFLTTSSQ